MSVPNATFTRTNSFTAEGERCMPRFFEDTVQDEVASAREGRPIFRTEERVQIIMPGNPLSSPVQVVNESHKQRWPKQYDQFKAGLEQAPDGTPLEEWPILNRAMVKELKHLEIHTIEQCAALDDQACQRIGMGALELRKKAQAYFDDAVRMSLVEQVTAENSKLRSEMAALKNQVEELGALLNKTHGELRAHQDAPSPLAAVAPADLDPIEQMKAASVAPHGSARGGSLADLGKRGRGRPRKNAA